MEMEWTSLELTVMSCRGLKAFNFFQKLSAYAVVSIVGDSKDGGKKNRKQKVVVQRHKTPIHRDREGNPEWNHTMHFDLKDLSVLDPSHDLFVKFDMHSKGVIYGNGTIGEVCVPLKDLIEECKGETVRFVSYQVRTNEGKPNGVLNFSYRATHEMMKKKKTASRVDVLPKEEESLSSSSYMDLSTEKEKYPSIEEEDNTSTKTTQWVISTRLGRETFTLNSICRELIECIIRQWVISTRWYISERNIYFLY